MCEFDSKARRDAPVIGWNHECKWCGKWWTSHLRPGEAGAACPKCREVELHKAVLRDKPQPRFDTREDWVKFMQGAGPRDTVTTAEVLNRIDWNLRVKEAERRNHARKIREAKAAIRAAHAKLAELRSTPPGSPPVRDNPGQAFADAVAYGLGAYRAPTFTAGEINPTLRRWPTAVGQRVVYRSPKAVPRKGAVRKLHPAFGQFEAVACVRFDDLPDTPENLVWLPATSLELIG